MFCPWMPVSICDQYASSSFLGIKSISLGQLFFTWRKIFSYHRFPLLGKKNLCKCLELFACFWDMLYDFGSFEWYFFRFRRMVLGYSSTLPVSRGVTLRNSTLGHFVLAWTSVCPYTHLLGQGCISHVAILDTTKTSQDPLEIKILKKKFLLRNNAKLASNWWFCLSLLVLEL